MEKINEIVNKLLEECQKEKMPVIVVFGKGKTYLAESDTLTDKTPDRIKRARTAFMNAPSETKGRMEFD